MLVGLIGILMLIIIIFFKLWIGIAMGIVGFLGYGYLMGWERALSVIGRESYLQISSYHLSAAPLFILMGMLVSYTGIAEDMYQAASKWIGQIRGGLAMATCLACGFFAAVTAGNLEATLAMSKIAFPEMKKHNYDDRLAVGCIAAGGTVGFLIPPSIIFIIYGILTETSIGKLFMAGIIPGITIIIFYIIVIYIMCLINPKLAEIAPKINFKEKVASLVGIIPMMCLFMFILWGIYGGIFTATEAGALGAFGAIIITLLYKRLTWEKFRLAAKEALAITASILVLMIGAYILMRFIAVSQLAAELGRFIAALDVPGYLLLGIIISFYLIAGCFLNTLAIVLLTVPIILPVIQAVGYSPIWFGVIIIRVSEVGMITPPIGLNVFIAAKATGLPVSTVYRGIFPFVVADVFHIMLLVALPQLSLYFPNFI